MVKNPYERRTTGGAGVPSKWHLISFNRSDTEKFAARWPGSVLRGRKVRVNFDPRGDLVDLIVDGNRDFDVPSAELAALLETFGFDEHGRPLRKPERIPWEKADVDRLARFHREHKERNPDPRIWEGERKIITKMLQEKLTRDELATELRWYSELAKKAGMIGDAEHLRILAYEARRTSPSHLLEDWKIQLSRDPRTPLGKSNPCKRSNPRRRVSSRALEKAVSLRRRFTGRNPRRAQSVEIPDPPRASVLLGELVQVNYRARKHGDGETVEYYHRFHRPRPRLVADPSGKRLYVSGGRFKITRRGIEH